MEMSNAAVTKSSPSNCAAANEETPLKALKAYQNVTILEDDDGTFGSSTSNSNHNRNMKLVAISCIFSLVFLVTAIHRMTSPREMEAPLLRQAMTPQMSDSSWATAWTSEEKTEGPVNCGKNPATGMGCKGWFCDNVRLYCEPTPAEWGAVSGPIHWVGYSSEETNEQYCTPGTYVNGLRCAGRFCDSVSLQCIGFEDHEPSDCYWTTGTFSSKEGMAMRGGGYFIQGIKCTGWFCQNKQLYWCK